MAVKEYFKVKTVSFDIEVSIDGEINLMKHLKDFLENKTNWAYKDLRINNKRSN